MDREAEIAERLATVPDPVALLVGIFALAPVAFQIFRADGHSLLTNQAFRDLFGSEPPPDYNVLRDELAARAGVLGLIQRAFAGETVSTPTIWYDPRELEQVKVVEGRRVAMSTTVFPLRDARGAVSHVALVVKDQTRETLAAERASALLRVASALSEASTFPEVVRAITVEAQAASGAEGAMLLALDEARSALGGTLPDGPVFEAGRAVLPLVSGGRALAVLQLSLPGGKQVSPPERDWLATLARLCAEAYERALIVDARARDSEAAADQARFLAAASAALGESLDLAATLQRICDLCVPRLGDYAVIDLVNGDERVERVASARTEAMRQDLLEIARQGGSVGPSRRAVEQMAPQILNHLDERHFRAVTTTDEQLAISLRVNPRSFVACPLIVRGAALGALGVGRVEAAMPYGDSEVTLLRDVAHRASLAIDGARQYADAQAAVSLRDDFLSIAGHELRTPLTSLFLQVQTLRRKLYKAELEPALLPLRHSADIAERQVRRLSSLVQQLLDVSRMQAGRLELDLEEVDLPQLLAEVVGRFEGDASGGSTITLEGPPQLVARWDRLRVDQVITNLLTNAVRYGEGRPIEVTIERRDAVAVVRVRDHGVGIAPEDHRRVFERFERAASVRNYGGVGLGLWIVHELVTAMGGRVLLESAKGAGATFTVELPT